MVSLSISYWDWCFLNLFINDLELGVSSEVFTFADDTLFCVVKGMTEKNLEIISLNWEIDIKMAAETSHKKVYSDELYWGKDIF